MSLSIARSSRYSGYFVAEESSVGRVSYPSVYLDTSIASYLTARLARDFLVARRQRLTRIWWQRYRKNHDLFVSDRVIAEAREGDVTASEARMEALANIRGLTLDARAESLAHTLVGRRLLPTKASADAEHIAIAATNGVDVLLTWNCRHLANPLIHREIVRMCESGGTPCPAIYSSEQLMRTYVHARSPA